MEIKVESKKAEISRAEINRLKKIYPDKTVRKSTPLEKGRIHRAGLQKCLKEMVRLEIKGLYIFDVRHLQP